MGTTTSKGSGSFCIPSQAVGVLIEADIETEAIGAYLVIALFTSADGVSSSAGIQALEKYLKCGKTFAEKQIAQLVKVGLVRDLRFDLGDDYRKHSAVRFLLNDFNEALEDRVWFDRSLVEYTETKSKESNVYRLNQMRPECIRVLLWMYANQQFGATTVRYPIPSMHMPGVMVRYEWDEDKTLLSATCKIKVAHLPSFELHPYSLLAAYDDIKLEKAVQTLQKTGFVYEVIMAWDQPLMTCPGDVDELGYLADDAQPLYQLHVRKSYGQLSDDEVGVSHLTLKVTKRADVSVNSHDGVLDNTFVVISKPDQEVGVVGVFRLSHRVKNPKNLGVKEAWASLMDSERAYRKWLTHTIEDSFEDLAQTTRFEAKTQRILERRPQS